MENSDNILQAEKLAKRIETPTQTLEILREVDLSVKSGQAIAICGASGSGKSTLLSLLAGIDRPTAGEVILEGHRLNTLNEEQLTELRKKTLSFIFQSFQLIPSLTALENVLLALELANIDAADQQANLWLEKVGLSARLNHFPHQLSGGEQQRVAIARAFAVKPRILFADEITSNLDENTGRMIADLLFELNQTEETTLIVVTHDQQVAERCEQIYQLQQGMLNLL